MNYKKSIKDHIKTIINKLFYSREKGLDRELSFWKKWIETKGLEWQEDYNFRLSPDSPLLPKISQLVSELKTDQVKILDVGSGPLTRIGYRHPESEIELKACDPLAEKYNKLLDDHKVKAPVRVAQVDGENLLDHYGKDRFHICTAMNCLDHSENPMKIIKQMMDVCQSGGFVYLCHAQNEAITENYQGLHRWNFSLNPNDEFVMSSFGKSHNLNKELAQHKIEGKMEGEMIHVTMKKQ